MSEYFSNFPKILYDIEGKNKVRPNYSTVINIMIRQKFRDAIKEDITVYYPYYIEEGQRPDVLSFEIYGDTKYVWMIFMVNSIIDPYWQWPLDAKQFVKYIENKYGTAGAAKTNVHHYEQIIRHRVERTGTSDPIEEVTVEVDYASFQAAGEDNRKIIYDFDYEMTKNDDRRSINLIQPTFVAGILDEVRQTFR